MGHGIADARVACAEHRWGDAWRTYSAVATADLEVEDLDLAATAAFLTGNNEHSVARWVAAHQRSVEAGSLHAAAHYGMRLAQTLCFTGDLPRAHGWVDRTAHLLEDAEVDCVEQGHLHQAQGMLLVFESGDLPGALTHFEQARKIAARFADRELATLSKITSGRMQIYLGSMTEGLALLDEAMVAVEAGEIEPLTTGDAYCTVIDACAELSDLVRCRAWTTSMLAWCDTQQELVLYRGHCFVHHADVLLHEGRWPEALEAARRACDRLAGTVPMAYPGASGVEADALRLLGDLAGADEAYRRAHELGHDPQPGMSLLRLDLGEADAAAAMIRRVVAQAEDPISRSRLLDALVEIVLAEGDVDGARDAAEELRGIGVELGSPMASARAARAHGLVHLADGDPSAALQDLRRAFVAFRELGAHHEATRTRLALADACSALGDDATAVMERDAAARAVEGFRLAPPSGDVELPEGLTERELDVLRLLAAGNTNRAIAGELFISEKTVASHVSHIFTKLGVGNRAAATAWAYDHRLV